LDEYRFLGMYFVIVNQLFKVLLDIANLYVQMNTRETLIIVV